ncbi:NADPH-dependent FMN reductase [Pengzhenrongella phosphoraccumulans]|uniref:NADPH-dependent FMN reductase n=1 Tax=Pengzhenrongella phosphoraccumulans TaxID=3114394 RepID=UPI00388FC997
MSTRLPMASGLPLAVAVERGRERGPASGSVRVLLVDALGLLLAFNPDDDHDPLPAAVADLRTRLAAADAVLFCTPGYAGGLPGSFKNLLDWTVGGGELHGKPVAWITVAAEGRGDGARMSLATVLGYVGARVVVGACARVPVSSSAIGPDGLVEDPGVRASISDSLRMIADAVRTPGG